MAASSDERTNERTNARLPYFAVVFFSSTFMRSVPVVKKALIVFHQCCMRSAASAAAAVAPIVSSFCRFSAKKGRVFESSWHFEAEILCCFSGRCDDSWAGWCCEEENTLSFLKKNKKKTKRYGTEWGKSVASYIDTQQLHENEKVWQHNATSV